MKKLKLTDTELNLIYNLLKRNHCEGSFWGNQEQFYNRQDRIIEKVEKLLLDKTMAKHEIEIPDLPEGWWPVEARIDPDLTKYIGDDGNLYLKAKVKLEKIKPRRVVLEETEEDTDPLLYQPIKIDGLCVLMVMHNKIWRVVEEE